MADTRSTPEREAILNRAQRHFAAVDRRNADSRDAIAAEKAALNAKTLKLRALRLAKEEADRAAAANPSSMAPVKSRTRKSVT